MKSKSLLQSSLPAVLGVALLGFYLAPAASADSAFGKARGLYQGTITAKAKGIPGLLIPKTPATLKLPRGKGRVVVTIQVAKIKGRITKAKVRQGGKKVIQIGKLKVPATNPAGLGSVTGPFRSVVILGAGKPTVRATTTLKAGGATVKGKFKGSK